ncbi:MAG: hypothetical protein WC069_04560 [Candidatus Shapirobacteria bacterium]
MPNECNLQGIIGDLCRSGEQCLLASKLQQVDKLPADQIGHELASIEQDSRNGCACGIKIRQSILEYLRSKNSQ